MNVKIRKFISIAGCMIISCINYAYSQFYSNLLDSCYHYLDKGNGESFGKTYVRLLDAYEKEYDAELYSIRKELTEMRVKDQSIRLLLIDAQGKNKHIPEIRKIMSGIDSINAVRVTEIIDRYGWLAPDDIGYEANEALFLCLQHSQDSLIQNRYLPILKEAVGSGAAKGWQYAFLADRCLMNQGKKQIYGTQRITKDKIDYLVPLQNIDEADSLRKDLGLEPLSDYMSDCGLKDGWTEEYYKQNLKQHEAIYQSWFDNRIIGKSPEICNFTE